MIIVNKPGMMSSFQDLGRIGYLRHGLPAAGCMDNYSCYLANWLVGNPKEAAVIEVTLTGPELYFESSAVVGIAGATFDVTLNGEAIDTQKTIVVPPESTLRFLSLRVGCRAYIAVAGGFAIESVLGSQSTYTPAQIGPLRGRLLAQNDCLPLLNASSHMLDNVTVRKIPGELNIPYSNQWVLRVVDGVEYDQFTESSKQSFFSTAFQVSVQSNRMGYRLQRPSTSSELQQVSLQEMITTALVPGSIQVTSEGDPIITLADGQTSGGYPRIANVIQADYHLLGQIKPRDFVRFYRVSLAKAISLHRDKQQWITQHLFPAG